MQQNTIALIFCSFINSWDEQNTLQNVRCDENRLDMCRNGKTLFNRWKKQKYRRKPAQSVISATHRKKLAYRQQWPWNQ